MPPEVKEKQQMDRMEQNLSGVSARFDELTARFESSINSLKDALRTQSADLNAHADQYNSRFIQMEHAFEAMQMTLNQQSIRLTALEQTAGWVSSLMAGGQSAASVKTATPSYGGSPAAVNTSGNASPTSGTPTSATPTSGTTTSASPNSAPQASGSGGATTAPVSDGANVSGGAGAATTVSRNAATASTAPSGGVGTSGTVDSKRLVYPDVANASSYFGASLQAGGAMIGTPSLAHGWTQALAFAPAAVGLVDDMVADVDNKMALKRAAVSGIAGGALLLLAKAIK